MNAHTPIDQPRAIGEAQVSSQPGPLGSAIGTLRHSGALKFLFPRSRDVLHAMLVNTAGGITGGDRFSIMASAETGSTLTLTTQAAERIYRAQPGQTGQLSTSLKVAKDARLNWLPQETILFEQSALDRCLDVELEHGAEFLMVEPLLFGRQAMGEDPQDICFTDRISVCRNGNLIYRDGLRLRGDVAAHLDRPAIAGGARAMASLIFVHPTAQAMLEPVRGLIGAQGGASLLGDDLLVIRLLGLDGYALRKVLLPVLDRLTQHQLPVNWRL